MSLSTMYIATVSVVPAALGVFLLTLANIDGVHSKADPSRQATVDQQPIQYQPYAATGGEAELPGFSSLFHRGATQ